MCFYCDDIQQFDLIHFDLVTFERRQMLKKTTTIEKKNHPNTKRIGIAEHLGGKYVACCCYCG